MISLTIGATLLLLAPQMQDSASPTRIRVGGNVQAANLIKKVTPAYPPLAKQARIQGTVRFVAYIGKDGSMEKLELVSGHPMLVTAAQEAVSQWQYRPTLLNGEPVAVITQIDVNFTLSEDIAWTVTWDLLSKFPAAAGRQPDPSDAKMPAKLLADGTLQGDHSLRGLKIATLVLDGVPIEPSVVLTRNAKMPGVIASWTQMSQRILARHEAVKPRADASGKVFLSVVVNTEGNIADVARAVGPEDLVVEAKRVITDWKFRPVVINGSAVDVLTVIPFDF